MLYHMVLYQQNGITSSSGSTYSKASRLAGDNELYMPRHGILTNAWLDPCLSQLITCLKIFIKTW